MRAHIHTDGIAALFTLGVVVVGLHVMRGGGAWMARRGIPGGAVIGGLATFN